ncbi:hypothetical protein BLNAU_14956 [Blattamonas nauphoetae]|uniref:Uncharacterized protein n=1 Tax=Blattamonas nauphoetae TaxID=2049346 RepID=A0ABQ9XH29_9EUKA|nr:hypothetical protein BLNAU_14956 [Blattamonas nauphoetae]
MFMTEQNVAEDSSDTPDPYSGLNDFEYLDTGFSSGVLENENDWNSFVADDHSANLPFLSPCTTSTIPIGPALTPISGIPFSERSLSGESDQPHNTVGVPREVVSQSPPPQSAMSISPFPAGAPPLPLLLSIRFPLPERHQSFPSDVHLPESPTGGRVAIKDQSQLRGPIVGVSINELEFVGVTKGDSRFLLNPASMIIRVGSFAVEMDSHLVGNASDLGIRVSSSHLSERWMNDALRSENNGLSLNLRYSDISCRVGQERTQNKTNVQYLVTVTINSVNRTNREGLWFGSSVLRMMKGEEPEQVNIRTVGVIVEKNRRSAEGFARWIIDRWPEKG